MANTRRKVELTLNDDRPDLAALMGRIGLSFIPVYGSLLGELWTRAIPNQITDRLRDIAIDLNNRINQLDEELARLLIKNESFGEFVRRVTEQYSHADSIERREYIKHLLSDGLTTDKVKLDQKKYLLSLLGQVTDTAVIILALHENKLNTKIDKEVLKGMGLNESGQFETEEERVFFNGFKQTLIQLGLIELLPNPKPLRTTKGPDSTYQEMLKEQVYKKQERDQNCKITSLGTQLLREIGLAVDAPA